MKDSDLDWMKPGAGTAEAARKRSSECSDETTAAVKNAIYFANRHRASICADEFVGVSSCPYPERFGTVTVDV